MTAALELPANLDRRNHLPGLLSRAAQHLASASTAAEVLEAREQFSVAYDEAKRVERLAKAKKAHDEVLASIHRAQADALDGEARAKRILADEYDAAQERGEVAGHGGDRKINIPVGNLEAIGLTPKEVHEAREIRDAEQAEPGIVRRALDTIVEAGEAPTRAAVKRTVKTKSKRKRHPRPVLNDPKESQHDRDLRMLLGVWESACESARQAFVEAISN